MFAFAVIPMISFSQWQIIYDPLPEGASFRGMSFVNDSTGFVSFYHEANDEFNFFVANGVLRTTDYAATWDTVFYHQVNCPCPVDSLYSLTDVFFMNADLGWVGTDEAAFSLLSDVLKTTDGGQSWQHYETGVESLLQIKFLDENYGVGTSPYNQGAETFDGGETWVTVSELGCYNVFLFDSCNGFAVDSGTLDRYNDCNWTTEEFPTLNDEPSRHGRAIHAWDEQTYLMGTHSILGFNDFGSIMRTIDGGATYSVLDWYFGESPGHFEFVNDSVGFVCVGSSTLTYEALYKTFDRGITWYGQITPLNGFGNYSGFSDIECLNENLCYAMNSKYIYKTTNGGGELGTMWTGVETTPIQQTDISLFPNPTTRELNIESSILISKILILDLTGRIVFTIRPNAGQTQLSLDSLSNGCYFLTATLANGNTVTRKFLKE